jgi:hypothetical protein
VTTTRKTPIKYRRGKPIPAARHGDVIDLTSFPLRSKPRTSRPIALCPKCGRKGEFVSYPKAGTSSYTHTIRFETMFWMVLEACHVSEQAQF